MVKGTKCRSRHENVREGGIQEEVVLEKPAKEQKVHGRQLNNSNSTLRFHNKFTRYIAQEELVEEQNAEGQMVELWKL